MKKYIIDVGTAHDAPKGTALRDKHGIPVVFIEPNTDSLNKVPSKENDIKINAAITTYDGEINWDYFTKNKKQIINLITFNEFKEIY